MEYFDILNEKGEKTGIIKERSAVHADGDLHGTSHIWIARRSPDTGRIQVLLQKRSKNKDSFPGCLDTSSAGHIESGSDFLESAIRELKEELGISAKPEELIFLFTLRTHKEGVFYERKFIDNQISRIYFLNKSINTEDLTLQKSEIESVIWEDIDEVLRKLKSKDKSYCANPDELEGVRRAITEKGFFG